MNKTQTQNKNFHIIHFLHESGSEKPTRVMGMQNEVQFSNNSLVLLKSLSLGKKKKTTTTTHVKR